MIKPLPPFMAMWKLQSLFAPEPFHLLVIDCPAFDTQELCDLTIAITTILFGKAYQGQPQTLIITLYGLIVIGGTCKANRFAGVPLGRPKLLAHMDYSLTQIGNRQTLGFKKSRLSLRISLSSSSSVTIFFSRAFSFSRAFNSRS